MSIAIVKKSRQTKIVDGVCLHQLTSCSDGAAYEMLGEYSDGRLIEVRPLALLSAFSCNGQILHMNEEYVNHININKSLLTGYREDRLVVLGAMYYLGRIFLNGMRGEPFDWVRKYGVSDIIRNHYEWPQYSLVHKLTE